MSSDHKLSIPHVDSKTFALHTIFQHLQLGLCARSESQQQQQDRLQTGDPKGPYCETRRVIVPQS